VLPDVIENTFPLEMIVTTPFTGQLSSGSGNQIIFFTQASNPVTVLNNIFGAYLFPSGEINLPNGIYQISADLSSYCTTSNVTVASQFVLLSQDNTIPFSSNNFGDILTIENYTTGFDQVYQNVSPVIWNTTMNGNNLYCYVSLNYTGGGYCASTCVLVITQLMTPYSVSVASPFVRVPPTRTRVLGLSSPSINVTHEDYVNVSPHMKLSVSPNVD